jgi:hypothetical protein
MVFKITAKEENTRNGQLVYRFSVEDVANVWSYCGIIACAEDFARFKVGDTVLIRMAPAPKVQESPVAA